MLQLMPAPPCQSCDSLFPVSEEEQQVKELLEKLPGEGFAESDGWLLEDGNDSASP